MNPESIRRRTFGCVRSLCSIPVAAATLFLFSPTSHSAETAATNTTATARATAPTGWKVIAEGGSDADLLNDPAAAAPANSNAHPMRLTIRQRDGAVGIKESAAGQTDIAAGQ